MGGEGGAAQTHKAAVLYQGNQLSGRQAFPFHAVFVVKGLRRKGIGFDDDGLHHFAAGMMAGLDGGNRARDRGVQADGNKSAGFGDQLSPPHLIARLHPCPRRGAEMLAERQNQFIHKRHALNRQMAGQILEIPGMNTVTEGGQTLAEEIDHCPASFPFSMLSARRCRYS